MERLKRIISALLSLLMILGTITFPSPTFAERNSKEVLEADYKIENVDGKSYKVYEFTDLVGTPEVNRQIEAYGLEVSGPRIMRAVGSPNPELGDEIPDASRYAVDVDWTTYDLQPGDLGTPVYFQIYEKTSKKIIAQTDNVTARKKYNFKKLPAWDDSDVSHDPNNWQVRAPNEYRFDIRLRTGMIGRAISENLKATIIQRSMPIYRAEYYTNKTIPKIEAQRTDKYDDTDTVSINSENLTGDQYYSWAKAISDVQKPFFEGRLLDIQKYGTTPLNSLEVSDDITAGRVKMAMKAPGKTEFDRGPGTFEDNGTPYHYEVTGDYLHLHIFTIRQDLKVKFDPNGGTWKNSAPADQTIGHSMKLADSWAGLGPINVPGAGDLTPPAEAGKPEKKFIGWNTDKNATTALFTDNTYDQPITKDETFYAIYVEKPQGKVAIQYVDKDTTKAIDDKYHLDGQKYPANIEGNVGDPVDVKKIPEPKFIGYKRVEGEAGKIDVTGKTYNEQLIQTVEVKYEKLPSVIPEKDGDKTNTKPDGYVTVTFKAGDHGKINGGTTDVNFFVNPKDDVKFGDSKISEPTVTADDTYDVKNPKWSPELNDAKKAKTITADATFTAQYEKQKGTVTYKYNANVNNTEVKNPDTSGIPTAPTDAKEYDAGTKVKAETTVAPKDKKVEVKKDGTLIGYWKFSGWTPAELEVKKNSEENKNEFTGTWTFEEAGKESVTYKFVSGTAGKTLPEGMPDAPEATQQYVGTKVNKPTTTYDAKEVKETINGKEVVTGKWTFEKWSPDSLTVKENATNEFVGTWNFTESPKGHLVYKFTSTDGDLPKAVKDLMPKDNKENYVGVVVKPDALTQTSVDGKKDNKEGTWKTEWTPEDVTLVKGENKVTIEWKFVPAKEGNVSYNFNIKPGVVPNDYNLDNAPFNVLKNNLEPKTAYVGRKVTAPIINQTYEEKITFKEGDKKVVKQGNWTFEGWDAPSKDMVEEGITFTGTWTWKQEKSEKPEVNKPKEGDKTITGKGKPESKIVIKDKDNNIVGETEVNNKGEWEVPVPKDKPLKNGDNFKVTQEEKGKTPSDPVDVTVGDNKPAPTPEPQPVPEVEIPGIKYKDHYTPTYPVYVSVPDKKEPVQDIFTHEQYIFGYPDDTIRPDGDMTRAEAIAVVARLQKLDLSDKTSNIYKDTKAGMWYNAAINAAFREGYLLEKEGENIRPNDKITRAELALLISHIDKKNDKVAPFEDVKGHKFEAAINQAYGNERIKGYPDGTFKPDNSITRAEVATMLNKLYDRYPDKNYIDANQNLVHNYKDMSYKGHWGYYELVEAYHTHKFARLANNMEEWKAIIK